ncbi:MAG: DegV family protein [Clostridia bacterium]|nr:DegV family protein [Clostridia bacterium]
MPKIAIATDSSSGIKISECQNNDVFVLPMPFIIDGNEYEEEISLSQEDFYEKLKENANISTSQPSPGKVTDFWDKILQTYDEIVYIPLSSGLSAATNTAKNLALDYPKVYVVDNNRVSVTQKESIYDALKLVQLGYNAKEIKQYLENTKLDSSIYITVASLKYLKKGGRITPAAAALGSLLKIKPILQIQGQKLDAYAKVLNFGQAKSKMITAIKNDIETRFKEYYDKGELRISVAHTDNLTEAQKFAEEIRKTFPNIKFLTIDPLSLVIACHIGPGSLAIAMSRIIKE